VLVKGIVSRYLLKVCFHGAQSASEKVIRGRWPPPPHQCLLVSWHLSAVGKRGREEVLTGRMEGVCVRADASARVECERDRRESKRGEASAGVKEGGRLAMRMRAGKCVLAEARGWMARACEPKRAYCA
jgi:hypothetical protein